jgi:hypothetical protein
MGRPLGTASGAVTPAAIVLIDRPSDRSNGILGLQ